MFKYMSHKCLNISHKCLNICLINVNKYPV